MTDLLIQSWLVSFILLLVRVSTFVATMPFFGGPFVARSIKAGMALALTCFWFGELGLGPANVLNAAGHTHWVGFAIAAGREVIIGGVLGLAFSLFLVPFRVAGEFIGQEMGLTLATLTDPTRGQFGTVVGQLFEIIGLLLFFMLEVHHVFLAALHSTFARRPVGGSLLHVPTAQYIDAMASSQEYGLLLAAPIVTCLFIATILLALMARAVPQLNLMSVGFVIRLSVGLIAGLLFLPELERSMHSILNRFSGLMYGLI